MSNIELSVEKTGRCAKGGGCLPLCYAIAGNRQIDGASSMLFRFVLLPRNVLRNRTVRIVQSQDQLEAMAIY